MAITSTFLSDEDKLEFWKYSVAEFSLIYSTKTVSIETDRLTKFNINNDYENNVFPVIRLTAVLTPSVYEELTQNKNDVKIKLRIQKFYTLKGSTEESLRRDWINTTFSVLMDDNYVNPDNSINTDAKLNTNGEASNSPTDLNDKNSNVIDLYLYNENSVSSMKTMINTVIKGGSLIHAISYIIAKSGLKNILISPLENNTVYQELLIPPQSALSALRWLDTEYGYYKAGSVIYFGIEKAYILNYKGGCTAWATNEVQETCFLIPERGGVHGATECGVEKVKQTTLRNYIAVWQDHTTVRNESNSNDIVEGNNATIINTNTNSITTTQSGAYQKGSGNTNVIMTNSSNKWLGDTYGAQKSANSTVISMSIGDFDIDAVTPNKKFTFLFEDSKYGDTYKGVYMLASASFQFIKNGQNLELNSTMVLKRTGTDVKVASETV